MAKAVFLSFGLIQFCYFQVCVNRRERKRSQRLGPWQQLPPKCVQTRNTSAVGACGPPEPPNPYQVT